MMKYFLSAAMAADITPKMQPKIDKYKKQAEMWAADPLIVKSVKESPSQSITSDASSRRIPRAFIMVDSSAGFYSSYVT